MSLRFLLCVPTQLCWTEMKHMLCSGNLTTIQPLSCFPSGDIRLCLTMDVSIFISADSIARAWKILDQIPGKATGAYSHSQVCCIVILKHTLSL